MLEFNFTPFPVLRTERLCLRKATIDDAPVVYFLRSNAQVLKYIERDPAQTIDEAISFIQRVNEAADNNTGISWSVCLADSDKMIGTIALWRLIKEHHRAEIGYVLHPEHQGKGMMNEAMVAVLEYAFQTMNLHSIEANINPLNVASQRLLERNKFVKEAHFKENYHYKGQFFDSAIYSLVRGQ